MTNFLVDALKKELAGYERRGLSERAKQVVEQLVLLGCEDLLPTLKSSSPVPVEEDSPEPPKAVKAQPRKMRAVIKPAASKPDAKKK
jgi:hypothetical protein